MAFSEDNFKTWFDLKKKERKYKIGSREYTSYIGEVDTFKKYMLALAMRNGYGGYRQTVLLSDGAPWIRNLREELFPDAQQILDFFHLAKNVTDFAKIIFNKDEIKYKSWSKNVCDLFKAGKTTDAIRQIKIFSDDRLSKNILNYINNNISFIDYATYRKKGWFIGSGAIESANRTVLQQRLKQPGMRWNIENGQHIVTLMAKAKSGLWNRDVEKATLRHYKVKNYY
ncbi:MAG: hypothetical protein LBP22_11190 [Deltaproteobacteria bacterium]|jgi:hypothetical protein|nr:hypothetical protein [Deltaproteobacteria bacterium]